MSRSARLHYPGGVFHIISRCVNREFLLEGAAERARYVSLLEAASLPTDARVLACCVMSNHVPLVVRAGEEPLARLMKRVNTGYALWKNKRNRRLGPLFAGRYKALLVEHERRGRDAALGLAWTPRSTWYARSSVWSERSLT